MPMAIKRLSILLLVLSILSVFVLPVNAESKPVKNVTLDVEPGKTLEVKLRSGGAINIRGWDQKKVNVEVRLGSNNPGDWIIDIGKNSMGVLVETVYKGARDSDISSSNVEIRVPHVFDIKLITMGGTVTLDNIRGDISGKTMGGNVFLSNLGNTINLKTMGGNIMFKDSDIDGTVKTMGGRVVLENIVGDVEGISFGGNVIYKNVKQRSVRSTRKVVNIKTLGGAIDVNEARYGAHVETNGGHIHVHSANEFVEAVTLGGDITIDAIDGYVDASTAGGDIEVTMTGDPEKKKRSVLLSSKGGNIKLTVPKNLSMEVELEIAYTQDSAKNYRFHTDLEIDETQTDRWQTADGETKKYRYGKAVIKGGKHKVRITTVNGNIYLERK